jgi:hypothetical protein
LAEVGSLQFAGHFVSSFEFGHSSFIRGLEFGDSSFAYLGLQEIKSGDKIMGLGCCSLLGGEAKAQ